MLPNMPATMLASNVIPITTFVPQNHSDRIADDDDDDDAAVGGELLLLLPHWFMLLQHEPLDMRECRCRLLFIIVVVLVDGTLLFILFLYEVAAIVLSLIRALANQEVSISMVSCFLSLPNRLFSYDIAVVTGTTHNDQRKWRRVANTIWT
jgi:hypothetical protein